MFNFHLFINYLKHLKSANNRYGVHSPFVYNLIDTVIYNFKNNVDYIEIEKVRKKLLENENYITVTDLGAGSYANNNSQKQVKQIAKNALKSKKLAQLIYRLVKNLNPTNAIEFGTCLGLTTAYISKAAPLANVFTMEGCPQTAVLAKQNLNTLQAHNVQVLVGDFNQTLPNLISNLPQLDFVFVDGNHKEKATLNYFKDILPKANQNSLFIFDDIYWSPGMKKAWQQIKQHPQVTLTIDLFWIGLVFFKTGRKKEHFKIKF
jgi:predicted O-methyltransferase YrrM